MVVPEPPAAESPAGNPAGGNPVTSDTGNDAEQWQSLYRRYRPQRFGDVRGQNHVSETLRKAVRDSKVAHAYLFSGPRGTGKTSTARILAMALNCARPVDGEPDGTCESCADIRRGASLDVHELDAASNRRIEEMRVLLSRVALGNRGRWKVYIVDEVHQLTGDAASALLKTLEEPPPHVVFVLATTDPQRVMPTIRSRTQHFEFRLLGPEVLAGLLHDVNEKAALGVPQEAIDLVVRRGHGSARDALSVLDQVAAAGTVEDEATIVTEIVDAVADRDPGRALLAVAEAMSAGRDPRRLVADLLVHLRHGFLATQAPGLVLLSDDATSDVKAQANRLGAAGLTRAMELLGQASIDMRDSVDPRITLEVTIVRLAAPAADHSPAALLARIERLEQSIGERAEPAARPPAPTPAAPAAGRSVDDPPATNSGTSSTHTFPRPASDRLSRDRQPGDRPSGERAASDRPGPGGPGRGPSAVPPPPPPPPGPTSAPPGRPSLGAHRRPTQAPPPPRPAPTSPTASPTGAPARTDSPAHSAASGAGAPGAGGLPTRDELTKGWGDVVLPGLRLGVKAYLSAGRFVRVEPDAAVFALPDAGLRRRAEAVRGEAEAALAAHFGRPVPLRLVEDSETRTVVDDRPAAPVPAPADEDPASYDLTEMEDAGPGVVSPEQRLLDAFPGAEEVNP